MHFVQATEDHHQTQYNQILEQLSSQYAEFQTRLGHGDHGGQGERCGWWQGQGLGRRRSRY